MAHLPPEPHWLQSWPHRLGAGLRLPQFSTGMHRPGVWNECHHPQLNSCTTGVLVSKDSETQVGGCFSLRAPLLPSFGAGVPGEESAEGNSEDLNLGAQPVS